MIRALVMLLLLCGIAHAEITKQPKLLQAVAPDYPPEALAAGKQAKNQSVHAKRSLRLRCCCLPSVGSWSIARLCCYVRRTAIKRALLA